MKQLLLVFSVLTTVGCASVNTSNKPTTNYLSNFKVDCNKAHEQYQYIESLEPTPWEKQVAQFTTMSVTGSVGSAITGDYKNRKDITSGRYEANLSMIKHNIRSQCGYKEYR